ncbi:BolA family transcriptional regulator [Candidatus Aerophobetes bacterium]|uniref:BolA family transcriptional regulator n=1 Tax=Aerophobetes bacterium TaxID=2030807 RepID=A0A2A4YHE3_UNCAE|nr:MAG: BolA family transcriptional regulator [Candidatus Aerophobetes bacterium]
MIEDIKKIIEGTIDGSIAIVENPQGDDKHFEAIVISEKFEDKTLVMQHKMVMNALKEKFDTSLHALRLKTLTLKEYEVIQEELKCNEI